MIRRAIRSIKGNRRLHIMVALFLVLIVYQVYHIYSTYNAEQTLIQDTLDYLQEKRAYDIETDIADINVYLASMKEKTNMSTVVFSDERDVIYFYAYEPGTTNIRQIDGEQVDGANSILDFKHEEIE